MKKQEIFEEIKKINERLDKIEKKLEEQPIEQWSDKFETISQGVGTDPCKNCSNNPDNGGSGVCFCTIPYFNKTSGVTYDVRR